MTMTNEEAIAFFKDMNECTYGNLEAVEMAIQALAQEPNCPYYVIDDDGHGLCTNHRYIPTMYYPQVEGITPTVINNGIELPESEDKG